MSSTGGGRPADRGWDAADLGDQPRLRALETLLFLFPPVVGVGAVGVLGETGVPLVERGVVLFTAVAYALLSIGVPLSLYLDAARVRQRGPWRPRAGLYGLASLLAAPVAVAPVVALVYLYRRHRKLPPPPSDDRWWLVVAASLVATVAGVLFAGVGVLLETPGVVLAGVGLLGAVTFGVFPVAIYRDAAYVRARRGEWLPNPALYLALAFAGLFVGVLHPLVAGYYLARRHEELGVP